MMPLQYNYYYIITLAYPPHSTRALQHDILVQYKGYYIDKNTGKESIIFHHRVPNFFESLKILSHVGINFIENEQDNCLWETHIYANRFQVKTNLTPVIRKACNKFKRLITQH